MFNDERRNDVYFVLLSFIVVVIDVVVDVVVIVVFVFVSFVLGLEGDVDAQLHRRVSTVLRFILGTLRFILRIIHRSAQNLAQKGVFCARFCADANIFGPKSGGVVMIQGFFGI